jgi:hypothetical protein
MSEKIGEDPLRNEALTLQFGGRSMSEIFWLQQSWEGFTSMNWQLSKKKKKELKCLMWRECWLWEFSDIIHSWLSSLGRSNVPITVLVLPGQLQQGSISSEHSKFLKVNSWNEFGIVDNLSDEEFIVWDRLWIVICESIQIVGARWLNAKSHSLVISTLDQEFATSDVVLDQNFDKLLLSNVLWSDHLWMRIVRLCVHLSIEKSKRSRSLSKSCNNEFPWLTGWSTVAQFDWSFSMEFNAVSGSSFSRDSQNFRAPGRLLDMFAT